MLRFFVFEVEFPKRLARSFLFQNIAASRVGETRKQFLKPPLFFPRSLNIKTRVQVDVAIAYVHFCKICQKS